ncbi:hypothetical protein L1987_65474 [Smallanthus sonchifolius]|uniref:Uncharacterized protein n=1 Tax=Smallanthus sonchifolius TaxID=185202 RepID=A0ACB9BUM4_9ASTR|nr:hypothetical protein L1987_65474 [Smallanthus sonchifolius]
MNFNPNNFKGSALHVWSSQLYTSSPMLPELWQQLTCFLSSFLSKGEGHTSEMAMERPMAMASSESSASTVISFLESWR